MPPVGYEAVITAFDQVVNINTLVANTDLQEFQRMEFLRQRPDRLGTKGYEAFSKIPTSQDVWAQLMGKTLAADSSILHSLEAHTPGITNTIKDSSIEQRAWVVESILNALRVDNSTVGISQLDSISSIKARLK